jgi:hypothetical protein
MAKIQIKSKKFTYFAPEIEKFHSSHGLIGR